jgi:hypothetical protein
MPDTTSKPVTTPVGAALKLVTSRVSIKVFLIKEYKCGINFITTTRFHLSQHPEFWSLKYGKRFDEGNTTSNAKTHV